MESLKDKIKIFLSVDSSNGCGSGSGSGNGYGYIIGSGCGHGRGDGNKYGWGYGDGYNSNSHADCSGCGAGFGYVYGCGAGSGVNLKSYNRQKVYQIDNIPTLINNVKGQYAIGYIINKEKTLEPCYIARCGDYFAHGETLHEAQRDALTKFQRNISKEERIAAFVIEHPSLDGVYPCEDLFKWHNILTGSCEMGRKQFCLDNGIDLKADYTVKYFLEITKDSYGGSIIKAVAERYKENEANNG